MNEICANCGEPVKKIHHSIGDKWMHVDPLVGSASAWMYCRVTVATPKPRVKS